MIIIIIIIIVIIIIIIIIKYFTVSSAAIKVLGKKGLGYQYRPRSDDNIRLINGYYRIPVILKTLDRQS